MLDGWTAQSDKKHYSIYSQLRYEVGGTNCCHLLCSKVKGQWVSEWVSSLSTSATLATAMGTNGGQSWALDRHAENVFASLDPAFLEHATVLGIKRMPDS